MKVIKVLLFVLLTTIGCSEKVKFNSNEWKNWVESEATLNTRWLMHSSLLKNNKLIGQFKVTFFCITQMK